MEGFCCIYKNEHFKCGLLWKLVRGKGEDWSGVRVKTQASSSWQCP